MGAYVDHDFQKGFILDEIRVRKLHELIGTRLDKLADPPALTIKVYRGDSFVYETSSVEDVLKEDNDDWRAVARLEFVAEKEDSFFFILRFSSRGTTINIVGDDRDAVFLIFSDIREYLQASVLAGLPVSREAIRLIGMLVMFAAMVGFLWSIVSSMLPDPTITAKAISSENVAEKLNYLINQRSERSLPIHSMTWLALLTLSMIISVSGALESGWRIIFPSNLFLFGRRKETYERRRSLLSKIFWGVFVALAVSILAGVVLAWRGIS